MKTTKKPAPKAKAKPPKRHYSRPRVVGYPPDESATIVTIQKIENLPDRWDHDRAQGLLAKVCERWKLDHRPLVLVANTPCMSEHDLEILKVRTSSEPRTQWAHVLHTLAHWAASKSELPWTHGKKFWGRLEDVRKMLEEDGGAA